ncbi:hypothetical protein HDU92_004878 [Lobulomyces angularis]|nr:hypothetical protein HDU92_004878 [Lobulomyces angularis]
MTKLTCLILIFISLLNVNALIFDRWRVIKPQCRVWDKIAAEMKTAFGGKSCNALATSAIRLSFHDAGTHNQCKNKKQKNSIKKKKKKVEKKGGSDGSIMIFPVELENANNLQFAKITSFLRSIQNKYPTEGFADIIQFAGILATVLCPGGPKIKFVAGRADATEANDASLLPGLFDTSEKLLKDFDRMGFTPTDLVALLGAHSCGRGTDFIFLPFDQTENKIDSRFYAEVLDEDGPRPGTQRLPSDENVSKDPVTHGTWVKFSQRPLAFKAAYRDAIYKMSLLGQDPTKVTLDCTEVLPDYTFINEFGGIFPTLPGAWLRKYLGRWINDEN